MNEDPIAIVGAACRLPGARDLNQFWDVLSSGRDVVTEIPDDRWAKEFFFHPDPAESGKSYTWAAGVIGAVDRFDAGFFGISPREAEQIDPQQRLLLELTWEALEDAGIPAAKVAGGGAGVYVGASSGDYGDIRTGDPAGGNAYFMTGVTASILANRISYIFDLHGPSFTVDTACSSSLVALDLACRAVREQRVPLAVVGGVSLLLAPYPFMGFCRASMLSPTGRCHAFDARADGYVRAEGGGVVLLKPLSRALADGDRIRGTILGTGINSDGRTIGLSLPSREAQTRLLQSVYREAGIGADALAFLEAHGTGTPAGDPIELAAVGEAISRKRSAALPVGSVKTNLGHLEAGSGMAGLLKAMLSLEHRLVPPSIHFETPNPNIPFGELNLAVVSAPTPLPADGPLIAGVNSFGFGGTNAHAILGSAPLRQAASDASAGLPPLLLSARSEGALRALAQTWANRLAELEPEQTAPLIRAAARHRDQHKLRLVASADRPFDLADKLESFALSGSSAMLAVGEAVAPAKTAFVYSGNGVQRPGMARDALANSAAFRAAVAEVDDLLRPALGWSVLDRLEHEDDPAVIGRTDIAQPLLFAVQVGITKVLRAQGVVATSYAGHSVGEIAAAWAAGALSLADACMVIVARSHQQQRTAGCGRMAALGLGAAEASELLAKLAGGLELAAINSSRAVTIAGPAESLARLECEATREGWRHTPLDLDYAFHSASLDFIQDDLLTDLAGLAPPACDGRFISTVEGGPVRGALLDAVYWWRNIREPVRFADAIQAMIGAGTNIFVEIGPNPALLSYIRDGLKTEDVAGRTISTLRYRGEPGDPFPAIAAECHIAGASIADAATFDGPADPAGLPSYPWQRERHWFAPTRDGFDLERPVQDHPLLGFRRDPAEWHWSNMVSARLQPWLDDHRIEGEVVVPGAALLEISAAAARARFPEAKALEVIGLEMPRALVLEPGSTRKLDVRHGEDGKLRIESHHRMGDEPSTLHAVAQIAVGSAVLPCVPAEQGAPCRRIEAADLYALADRLGLNYGPRFRVVDSVSISGHEAIVTFRRELPVRNGYIVDPALFDGALQGCLALLADRIEPAKGESFIPARFDRVRIFAPFGRQVATARITLGRVGVRSVSASVTLFDETGGWIAAADGCWFQRVRLSRQDSVAGMLFRMDQIPAPRAEDDRSPLVDLDAVLGAASQRQEPVDSAEAHLLFEAYLAARAYAALGALPQPIRSEALVETGAVAEEARPLLAWMLWLVERHGAAEASPDGWRLAEGDVLPDPGIVWRTILADHPDLAPELALGASADFAALLRGGNDAAPPASLVEHMLYASPSGRGALDALCKTVENILGAWPDGRAFRLLEIGAGGGILTRRLLARLARLPGSARYLATDPDSQGILRLAASMATLDGAWAEQWDPSDAAAPPPDGQFDLVVSMHGLTRLELDAQALERVNALLAPGGILLTAEPEPNEAWDVTFGRRADWWRAGVDPDFPVSAVRGSAGLTDALHRAGFAAPSVARLDAGLWPLSLIATRRLGEAAPIQGGEQQYITIVGADGDALATALADRLAEAGAAARIVSPAERHVLVEPSQPGAPRFVCLPARVRQIGSTVADRMESVLSVARTAAEASETATLWIVTRDAQTDGTTLASPAEAALWGLGRTLMNELPRLECRLIDLPAGWDKGDQARVLATELLAPDGEREIAWSDSGRRVLRLRAGLRAPAEPAPSIRLDVRQPGLLDTLRWQPAAERHPDKGEILIEARAVGLNFRDVMWAMGLLPEEALLDGFSGPTLGLECAGIVRAVGPDVGQFRVGDRVMALAPAALSSHVITAAHAVVSLPEGLSFEAAATLPVASLTVLYGLDHLARLQPGERVLIHGGAGGVGLLAIQFAQYRGATIFATAGSEAKRAFLRHLGVDHVLDSRDLGFADEVRALTGGEGVDVVLNSLSGEAMERSIGLLRPFGRFVELGKRDFALDTRVGLRNLRQNIAYFSVDIDRLPISRPELAAQLLRQVVDLVEEGALRPLPWRAYPFADVAEAFRLMQGSGHVGKIVLTPDDHFVPALSQPRPIVRDDRTYLVTGGLSGFGLATARWLADQGVRHLALVSRRGADAPEADAVLADFAASSVDARAFACDVADPAAIGALLDQIRRDMPPICGILHAAMIIDDGLAVDLTAERIARVMRPKLDGAINLDRLTRQDPIELFLMFSSATTILGAPGQGSYVAANMAVEAVARRRQAEGLPALAVAFGPIADAGVLAVEDAARESLVRRLATAPIAARQALDALPQLLASGAPVVALAPVRWDAANQHLPILKTPAFSDLAGKASEASHSDLRERLAELDPEEARELIVQLLTEEVARILSFAPDRIDPKRPLPEFGMDSLMAVELRLALETKLGIDVPLVSLSDNTTLSTLAKRIARTLSKQQAPGRLDEMMGLHEAGAEKSGDFEAKEAAE
jgi:acyl transferase domain-containing protein/acyl carrier protein